MILDDSEGFESLSKPDAVGDDAATISVQLVDRTDDSIPLELVEFLPDLVVQTLCISLLLRTGTLA